MYLRPHSVRITPCRDPEAPARQDRPAVIEAISIFAEKGLRVYSDQDQPAARGRLGEISVLRSGDGYSRCPPTAVPLSVMLVRLCRSRRDRRGEHGGVVMITTETITCPVWRQTGLAVGDIRPYSEEIPRTQGRATVRSNRNWTAGRADGQLLAATAAYMPIFARSFGLGLVSGCHKGTWTRPGSSGVKPTRKRSIAARGRKTKGAAAPS